MIFVIQIILIEEAIKDDNRMQYHTDSIGISKTLRRYHPRGALIRITLINVIKSNGVPSPSPCIIRLLVMPIVTRGYEKHTTLKYFIEICVIFSESVKNGTI